MNGIYWTHLNPLSNYRLCGQCGVLDVLDCILAARTLSSPPYSLVDPAWCVIKGLSASGYTVPPVRTTLTTHCTGCYPPKQTLPSMSVHLISVLSYNRPFCARACLTEVRVALRFQADGRSA